MSDTPRTDAAEYKQTDSNPPEPLGMVDVEFARQLERELNEAQHRIRTLIEERDRARIQADHKWKLREEFEALLGTNDVETGVERVKEAQRGAARYEYLRKLNPREFAMLNLFRVTADVHFDAEVDRRRIQT